MSIASACTTQAASSSAFARMRLSLESMRLPATSTWSSVTPVMPGLPISSASRRSSRRSSLAALPSAGARRSEAAAAPRPRPRRSLREKTVRIVFWKFDIMRCVQRVGLSCRSM